MDLGRKLARLEVLVRAQDPPVPTFWTSARIEQWRGWLVRLLETMPRERAELVYAELTTLPRERWGPLARHVDTMAVHAVMGAWNAYIEQGRPMALPEAVCAVLEAHPDAHPHSAHDCEDCGFETPVVHGRPFLTTCPLCGGAVKSQGFNGRRWHALWLQQKAELAARAHPGPGPTPAEPHEHE
jgi:hypothetical protein